MKSGLFKVAPALFGVVLLADFELPWELSLGVNAGHDLNQQNLPTFLDAVPRVLEVSIGHAIVCEAIADGLAITLDRYLAIVNQSRA